MRLQHTCSNTARQGQIATADIVTVSPGKPHNINRGGMVYRVSLFRLATDRPGEGWDLMPGEYRTLSGLLRTASRLGFVVID